MSNPDITSYMQAQNISGDYSKLESVYIHRLLDIVSSFPTNNGYIVWQEVFDNGVTVKDDTVINVWKKVTIYHNNSCLSTSRSTGSPRWPP